MSGLLPVVAGVQTSTPGSVLGGSTTAQSWVRTLAAVAGLAAIGASATLFTAGTHFPGTAALAPTLGACALLWAGEQQDGGDSDARAHALVAPMSRSIIIILSQLGNFSKNSFTSSFSCCTSTTASILHCSDQ